MTTPFQVLERVRGKLNPPQESTLLRPDEEVAFQDWYASHSRTLGLDPNPDPSERNRYDYRGAWAAGAEPDESRHWPSEFKLEGHPNLIVQGVDTRTGEPVKPQDVLTRVRQRQAIHAPGGRPVELPTVTVTGDAPEGPPPPRWDPEGGGYAAPYMPFQGMASARNRALAEDLRPGGPTATALQVMMTQFIPGRERRERIEDYIIEHADEGVSGEWATLLGLEAALGTAGREIAYMASLGPLVRPIGAAFVRLTQIEKAKLPRITAWLAEKAFRSTAASRTSAAVSSGARGAVEATSFGVARQTIEEGPEGVTPGQLFPYAVAGTGFGGLLGAITAVSISPARALISPREVRVFAEIQRRVQLDAQRGRLTPEQELDYAGTVLGLNPRTATDAQVGNVMKTRAGRYHPDGPNPDAELFKIYSEAASILRQRIDARTPRATARTAEETEAWRAAQRDPATGEITTDPRVTEPTYMRRGAPVPAEPVARPPAPAGAAAVAVAQPAAPAPAAGPQATRGVRGRHDRDLIETPRPGDRLPDVEERPLSGTMFSLEARSDIVPSVNTAGIEAQQILVRRMMDAHKIGQPDDPVLEGLGIDPAMVSVVESAGAWEGATPNMAMRFDPSIPYEQAREAMLSYSVRLGQRAGFMMQLVEPTFEGANPTRSAVLTLPEYYRLNDAIAQNPEKYPSIQGSSMVPTPAGRQHAVWVDDSGNHEYFTQQLQDAFVEAGIDAEASINHTRSEIPNAADYRQTVSRGFEEGVGRDLRELRETSVPVWAEVARGQGSETSDDVFAALEGYSAAVRHGTGVVPYSNTFRTDSHGIFNDLGKPPSFPQWRDAMGELGYANEQLTPQKFKAHQKAWKALKKELRPGEHMKSVSEIVRLARRGAAGKDWYYGFTDAMRPFMGDDAEVFTRIWAVSSQQAKFLNADGTPGKQLKDALRSYLEWKNGLEFTNTLLRHNLDRAVLGSGIGLAPTPAGKVAGGRKIGNFVPASLGDPDAVTVDLWIQRLFGFETERAPSNMMYDFVEHTIRRAAETLDWSGRQAQAALWENMRKESGIPGSPITAANGTVEMLKRVDWTTALEGQDWGSIRAIVEAAGQDPVPAWAVLQNVAEGFRSGGLGEGREWYAKPEVINKQIEDFGGEFPRYESGARATQLHPRRITEEQLAGNRAFMERGPDPAGYITGAAVTGPPATVGPREARRIVLPEQVPTGIGVGEITPELERAITNTPNVELTAEGIRAKVIRAQSALQAGQESGRTGVFYLVQGDKNLRHYKNKLRQVAGYDVPSFYGGETLVQGETLIPRPLAARGGTGGKVPERAFVQLRGRDEFEALSRDISGQLLSVHKPTVEAVSSVLFMYGGDASMAGEILASSTQGNQLRYAVQENVAATVARDAGYDAIVGISKRRSGDEFISEIFDVREVVYPVEGELGVLHPTVAERYAPTGGAALAGAVGPPTPTGPQVARGLHGKPKPPPRPGPPKPESRPAARKRLIGALESIEELAVQTEATKRMKLDDPLRSEISKVLRQVLLPAQVKAVLATDPKATTQLQAQTILERAMAQIEGELHRRAVDELQTKYKKVLQGKLRPEFLAKVQAAVEDIDFKTMSEKTRKTLEATARYLSEQPEGASPIPEYVLTQMRRMDLTSLKKMSFDEVYGIVDAIDLATHLNRTKNKLLGKHRARTRAEVAERIVKDVDRRLPTLRRPKTRQLEGRPTRGKLGLLLKEAATRPEVLMESASEGLRQLAWEDITVQGHHQQELLTWQYRDALTNKLKSVGHPMGTRAFEKWRTEPLELRGVRGSVQLSRDEAIWLLTSLKDPSNRRMFMKNGATIERSDREFQIDENTIADLNRQMGPAEQAIAKFLHDQFNGPLKEALNKAWVETYGFEVAKVEDYAPRSIDMTRQTTSSDPLEQLAADREGTLRSWGHLKERVGAGGPIRIGGAMDTYINHAEHVARLSAYLVPVNNLNAIIGRVDVKQALLKTIGREGYNRILNSVQMQTVRYPETTDSGRWMRTRMRAFGGSVLGIRLTTWFLNPSGIPISATYQEKGFQNMVESLSTPVKPGEWKRIVNLAERYSPYWRSRYTNFVHESTSGMTADRTRSYGPQGITELGLVPLQKSDQFGAIIRWRMAERFIGQQRPRVEAGTDNYYDLVAREWERMMYRGENTGHGGDMTGALALGRRNPYFAPLVMFTSSVSKIYSAGVRARLQLQRGDMKGSTKSFIGLVAALLWAAGVREGFARMRKPQDEPVTTALPKRALKDFLGFVPVLGPAVLQPLFSKATGGSAFSYPSSTLESTMQDMSNTGVAMITTIEKAMADELDAQGEAAYKKSLWKSIEGALQVGAAWFGVPWGWQDIPRLIQWLTPNKPDLRAELQELETPTTVTQENRRIVNSIQTWNPREFRKAIEELDVKGKRPTHGGVLAVINRRYGWVTKYEPGKDARDRLDDRQRELVDATIEERNEMRALADSMATANADLLAPTPRRR